MQNKHNLQPNQEPDRPWIFNHRHGTLTVFAEDEFTAYDKAKNQARGMPLTPAFQVHAPQT